MVGLCLAVDRFESPSLAERNKREYGCISPVVGKGDDRFSAEASAYGHAIKAADKGVALPYLNGVCVAVVVEVAVGLLHVGCDPCAIAIGALCGTGPDDLSEGVVGCDAPVARFEPAKK